MSSVVYPFAKNGLYWCGTAMVTGKGNVPAEIMKGSAAAKNLGRAHTLWASTDDGNGIILVTFTKFKTSMSLNIMTGCF